MFCTISMYTVQIAYFRMIHIWGQFKLQQQCKERVATGNHLWNILQVGSIKDIKHSNVKEDPRVVYILVRKISHLCESISCGWVCNITHDQISPIPSTTSVHFQAFWYLLWSGLILWSKTRCWVLKPRDLFEIQTACRKWPLHSVWYWMCLL